MWWAQVCPRTSLSLRGDYPHSLDIDIRLTMVCAKAFLVWSLPPSTLLQYLLFYILMTNNRRYKYQNYVTDHDVMNHNFMWGIEMGRLWLYGIPWREPQRFTQGLIISAWHDTVTIILSFMKRWRDMWAWQIMITLPLVTLAPYAAVTWLVAKLQVKICRKIKSHW